MAWKRNVAKVPTRPAGPVVGVLAVPEPVIAGHEGEAVIVGLVRRLIVQRQRQQRHPSNEEKQPDGHFNKGKFSEKIGIPEFRV